MKQLIFIIGMVSLMLTSCESPTTPEAAHVKMEEAKQQQQADNSIVFPENATISTDKNYYLVFDGSGSMDGSCGDGSKIDGAVAAMDKWLAQMPATDDVNLGLFVFDSNDEDGAERVPLGKNNSGAIKKAIHEINTGSGTPLCASIQKGVATLVERYKQQLGYGQYYLVIITDGESGDGNVQSTIVREISPYPWIGIYTIGLCLSNGHPLEAYSLKYYDARDPASITSAMVEIIAESESFQPTTYSAPAQGSNGTK